MALIETPAAAQRLGVSVRQVQRLVRAGSLRGVGPSRIDLESVLRYEQSVSGHRGRAWSEATAWAAVALLSGVDADWLGQPQLSRTRSTLRTISAEDFVGSCRGRAVVHRFGAHRSAARRLSAEVVGSGMSRGLSDLGAAVEAMVDGYVAASAVDSLADRHVLSTDGTGDLDVVLRATSFDLDVVRCIAEADEVLAGIDLATSLDVRERSAGVAVLTDRLERFT